MPRITDSRGHRPVIHTPLDKAILAVLAQGHIVTVSQLYALVIVEFQEHKQTTGERDVRNLLTKMLALGTVRIDISGHDGYTRWAAAPKVAPSGGDEP